MVGNGSVRLRSLQWYAGDDRNAYIHRAWIAIANTASDLTPCNAHLDSVLVLRGCGPKGYPGMPEVSNMPLPKGFSPRACATWCGSATAG
jgi:dihydroxyacid dehydratase/phosphogluconate dehydratase